MYGNKLTNAHTHILPQYTFAKRVDVLKCLVTFVNECGQDSNELKCEYLTSLLDSAFRQSANGFYTLDQQVYSVIKPQLDNYPGPNITVFLLDTGIPLGQAIDALALLTVYH